MINNIAEQHELRDCTFIDYKGSNAFKYIKHEIDVGAPGSGTRCYGLEDGDVVIDIGAHIGMISILMAKENPGVTFYAFEPMPIIYSFLVMNLMNNNIKNVKPFQLGIAGERKIMTLASNLSDNTGGSTMWARSSDLINTYPVRCITLDDAWSIAGGGDIKLLKIDCEGAEHEFIKTSENSDVWKHILNCSGELHENQFIRDKGYTNLKTAKLIDQLVKGTVRFQSVPIGE